MEVVSCGISYYLVEKCKSGWKVEAFDSSCGLCDCSGGTRREFVVCDRAQVYPEYAVVYERLESGKMRGAAEAPGEQRALSSDRLEGQRPLAL